LLLQKKNRNRFEDWLNRQQGYSLKYAYAFTEMDREYLQKPKT
jgi:hypothetical protein